MGYVGGQVTSLFGKPVQDVTRAAVADMASAGGERIKKLAAMNTPVKTGALRASWRKEGPVPYSSEGYKGFRATVSTDVSYAPYVEEGSGLYGPKHAPYVITPRTPGGTLRFVVDGRVVFAKSVVHPGSPGNHMMAIAMNVTDAEKQSGHLFGGQLEAWAHAAEGAAK